MFAGVIPSLFGLCLAYFLAKKLAQKGSKVMTVDLAPDVHKQLPAFMTAIAAPIVAIILLALRPIAGIVIDPLIALPIGGFIGILLMGKWQQTNHYMVSGLQRMAPVAIMLLGTGTLAGIIANSQLKDTLISMLSGSGLPSYLLAPISGVVMSMATASTTAGTAVASSVFSITLLELGITSLAAGAMIHAGATVLDHLPHGSFFHATGGAVNMQVSERLKLLPYETLVGLGIAIASTVIFGVFEFAG
jgi:GntP family gluconate:H+ symporter